MNAFGNTQVSGHVYALLGVLGFTYLTCACDVVELGIGTSPQQSQAIASVEGGAEMAVDAPWRIEPSIDANNQLQYGAIPILVAIHDADQFASPGPSVKYVYSMSVEELPPPGLEPEDMLAPASYDINDFHEIERTLTYWPWPDTGSAPPRQLCRRWRGDDCRAYADVDGMAEWHGLLMYEPVYNTFAGRDVRLRVTLNVDAKVTELLHPDNAFDPLHNPYVTLIRNIDMTTELRVHLGNAALPRFDERWVYGDLHYHSQGTDNDGESAYAYRGVLQAASAMGLDFVLASDHASNSEQIIDIYFSLLELGIDGTARGLRDMSPTRWSTSHAIINDSQGANAQILSYPRLDHSGLPAVPQLILGGEVDVIPEVAVGQTTVGYRSTVYAYFRACQELPYAAKLRYHGMSDYVCDSSLDLVTPTMDNRWLVHDVQGKAELDFYARQHILHLPADPTDPNAFVASNTSTYGGATRRLGEVLTHDMQIAHKGYTFLAHPFGVPSGDGAGRLGPDIYPYSELQLRDAFRSEYVLGLQTWNENKRLSTPMGQGDTEASIHNFVPVYDLAHWQHKDNTSVALAAKLYHGYVAWDDMNLWGLNPNETAALSWLEAGQPRRVFMAGGSDAHGDLNYRRSGNGFGVDGINDTTLASTRNLIFAGERQGPEIAAPGATQIRQAFSQQQIVEALHAGQFSVTDGPALRIAYDSNNNGVIDDSDIPMGGVVSRTNRCAFPLIVEWRSTPEFGPVDHVDLYLGIHSDSLNADLRWAPGHRSWADIPSFDPSQYSSARTWLDDVNNTSYLTVGDEYFVDPTGTLQIRVGSREAYQGRRVIQLDPRAFPVGQTRTEACANEDPTDRPIASTDELSAEGRDTAEDEFTRTSVGYDEVLAVDNTNPNSLTRDTATSAELTTETGSVATATLRTDDSRIITDDPILETPEPSDCQASYYLDNARTGDRMFVRAQAVTRPAPNRPSLCAEGACIHRFAFTNPVWFLLANSPRSEMCAAPLETRVLSTRR